MVGKTRWNKIDLLRLSEEVGEEDFMVLAARDGVKSLDRGKEVTESIVSLLWHTYSVNER